MNTLEAYSIESPSGKTEECAKFVIDDIENQFILSNIASVGQEYTFSFWIKSDTEGSVTVCDTTFPVTNEWSKHILTFVASEKDVSIWFDTTVTYFIYHPQLEIGNKATDWTPAPEDVDQSISDATNEVRVEIAEQNASIITTCNSIILSALESYVETSNYDEFKSTVETQLSIMAGEIAMNFASTTERIDGVDSDLQSEVSKWNKYITFSEDGINISAGKNAMSIRIDNDIIRFEKDGIIYGWWDGIDFHTGNIVVDVNERAQFGNFAYVPRSDGSLSFLKVRNNAGFYGLLKYGILTLYGSYPTVENTTLTFNDVSGELNNTTLILGG